MSKKSDVRKRIKKVMEDRGIKKQVEFSKELGEKPTTLNAWIKGASLPSPKAYARLSVSATHPEDSIFFLEEAGLTRDLIVSAAGKIRETDTKQAVHGKQRLVAPLVEKKLDPLWLPAEILSGFNADFARFIVVDRNAWTEATKEVFR